MNEHKRTIEYVVEVIRLMPHQFTMGDSEKFIALLNERLDEILEIHKALEQESSGDAISRAKAIEEADNLCLETGYDNEKVIEMLNDLPPVNPQEPKTIKVKTPAGVIVAEAKSAVGDYPGIWIYKDDNQPFNMMAAVEYNTPDERFQIEGYQAGMDEPRVIINYETGLARKRAVNIVWDYDEGEEGSFTELPNCVDIPASVNNDEVADWLSDNYGWCVVSFDIEII